MDVRRCWTDLFAAVFLLHAPALAPHGAARAQVADAPAAPRPDNQDASESHRKFVMLRSTGLVHEQKGGCKPAVEAYSQALQLEPQDNFVLGHRALCQHQMGNYAEALADSERALQKNPGWVELRAIRSNVFLLQNQKDAAAREAELLASENPSSKLALVTAGRMFAELGLRARAAAAFDRALLIGPDPYIFINKARSRPLGDKSGRLAALNAALKLEPRNPDVLAAKASHLSLFGDLRGALKLYDRALESSPDSIDLKLDRAVVLHRMGTEAVAEGEFRSLRAQAKSFYEFNDLCWVKAAAGIMLELALEECQQALRLGPQRAVALDTMGLVLFRLGRLDEAIGYFDQAIARMPFASPYYGRALAHSRKGNGALAEADRRQALGLDPAIEAEFAQYGLSFRGAR